MADPSAAKKGTKNRDRLTIIASVVIKVFNAKSKKRCWN